MTRRNSRTALWACLIAMPAAAWAAGPAASPSARQLEAAAELGPLGAPESYAAGASRWSDKAASRPNLAVQSGRETVHDPAWAPASPAPARKSRLEVPEVRGERVTSQDGRYARLGVGFMEVEYPAMRLMTKGWLGAVAGGLLALVLFVPAVIWGGLHAFF